MTWHKIQQYIAKHQLPYKVVRWNMSLRGVLVNLTNDQAVASNARDAWRYLYTPRGM